MNILNVLKQLRDDLKAWATNNFNALNAKIDEKTIPIDSELDSTSTNPVQNQAIATEIADINNRVGNTAVATQIANAIAKQPHFSGDYNDLTNAPNITEDDGGNMVIADESGNIIFKADADGMHTTTLTLNGETAATEAYVNAAIAEIPTPDVSGQIEAHNTSENAHEDIRQAINTAKEELSESIVAESDEWKVVDESGNIIFSVDASGAHTTELTLNGESAATESYVDDAIANIEFPTTDLTDYATKKYVDDAIDGIEIPEVDFTGYATETYVNNKVADLVNSAPEALNTLGELATALENHEDAYDALLETVGGKATKTELEEAKSELSESIVAETDEFHIVDEAGNIVASIDENGVTTTTVTAQSIIVNGDNVEEHVDNADIHVTTDEKVTWNNKSNFSGNYNDLTNKPTLFSGSYNDLTDKPAPTDLSNYYTKTEVDTAIGNIGIPETDLTNYYTKTETDTAIESAKEELSESIVSESEEWKIVDGNGNIIFSVDESGAHTTSLTLDGEDIKEIIDTKIESINIEIPNEIYVGDGEMPEGASIQLILDASDEEQLLKNEITDYIDSEVARAKTDLKSYVDNAILNGAW